MDKNLAYYISGHGYGHYARSLPVLKQLVSEFNLHIKTEVPEFLFKQHLDANHWLQPVDVGCRHSNSLNIDAEKTFKDFNIFQRSARAEAEKKWLRENQIALVLSDIASMPIKAAHELGIPAILIGNFTWHDIYSHLPGAEEQKNLLHELEEEYACADLQILPQCHLPKSLAKKTKEVGFIAQKGKSIRKDLEHHLNISFAGKTLTFIYLGQYGAGSVLWENLAQHKDCLYLTRDSIEKKVPNLHYLDDRFPFPDLIASVDLICTKGGYSTLGSAFASHKPVITCERKDFYEFKAIREYLQKTQTGVIIEDEDFYPGNWQTGIKTALSLTVKDKVPLNGEVEILESVHQILS
ncbi:MAG: hypothetical protein HN472_09490 [Nitrospina sp.]|nr:hypothetical protein [Nitrospina sp.]MBT3509758.1 hypothetical protein [Nitrospina sp.]MBT3874857.1 hypothetical protein [Nitrospina sp.]MBT4049756.1 hypothetical protein [Nitrospina sp.]MBT4558762.1 hypothetical protein [Nitrospina sp.]